jgi:hypothetical protein
MAGARSKEIASLMSMPTELLDQVACLLPKSALRALSLTCKKTRPSATDVLYKTYLNRTIPAKAPFYLFLRTLCERPDLAEKVKRVDIRGWRSEYEVKTGAAWRGLTEKRCTDEVERDGPSFSSTEKVVRGSATDRFKLFVEAAVTARLIPKPASLAVPALKSSMIWYTSLKEDSDFLRLLGRGVEDAHVVLMLALLHNLEVLQIDGLSRFPLLDWHQFLSRSSTALRSVSQLQVFGSNTPTEPVVNSFQFFDIMHALERLDISNVAAKGHKFTFSTLLSRKLSYLILSNYGISRRLYRKILDGQHITHFAYMPVYNYEVVGLAANLSATDMVSSLASSRQSLEKLTLFPVDAVNRSPLKMFENLDELEIPQPGLLDISQDEHDAETIASLLQTQLPGKLQAIFLRYLTYNAQAKTILEQLAHLKTQGVFPALKIVRLNFIRAHPTDLMVMGSLVVGGPVGGVTAATTWHSLPDVAAKVHEDLDKLYEDADLSVEVYQTEM